MTTTTNKRHGEGANYQFLPQQIREGRSISPKEKKILGYIISKCVLSSVYDNEGCIAISYDQLKKGAKVRSAGTIQYSIRSLVMGGYLTYKPGTHLNEANRYTLSPMLTDMINEKTKMINYIPADDKTDIDMALPEQQQPAPTVENIDYKKMYEDCKKMYDSVVARYGKWITDLSGMDSGKDGGKYIEEAVAYYRNRKDSNEQPDEDKNALQARLEKANQWQKGLGGIKFIEAAVEFYETYSDSNGQPDQKLRDENKQLKAEVEKLRKNIDASLQQDTPQEQDNGELQKYKNSLELAVNENKKLKAENEQLKEKLDDKHLNDEKNRRIADLDNQLREKDEEIKQLKVENEQQEEAHEAKVEELNDTITNLNGAIKILQSDLKKAKAQASSLVVEPSTPYGGNVKTIYCN